MEILTRELMDLEEYYCAENYKPLPVVIERAQDVWMWDVEGRKFLDIMGSYSALSLGHSHPRLIDVLSKQSQLLAVTSRAVYTKQLALMAKKICEITGLDKVLPMNTGAEAVDTALKAARRWGYEKKGIPDEKAEIIVVKENFHGRTFGAISLSNSQSSTYHYGPLLSGIRSVEFSNEKEMRAAITKNTCAVFLEPIQGEAGIIIPHKGYLRSVREMCDQNHVLMILDEIQSGLGRTGKWFCYQHENILPDGVTIGKALGGGLIPVSAFVATKELMSVFTPGTHGSTFGGNPLACAIALEALCVLEEEGLIHNSYELGEHLLERLNYMRRFLCVVGVRGRGLWAGIDLDPKIVDGRQMCELLLGKGIIAKETRTQTLRIAPALTITRDELDWALDQIEELLSEFL